MISNDYLSKHKELMNRWSEKELHKNKVFVQDGIIDLTRWKKTRRKILLLLKEAYGGESSWDLAYLIKNEWKGPKYKVWWTASYWLYAMQKMSNNYIPSFPDNEEQYKKCGEYLLSSAVVNIKKSSGKSTSDEEDLLKYITNDSELMVEQILLIDPDFILCGYTYDYFKKIWPEVPEKIHQTDFVYKTGKYVVVDYWHPANHYPNHLCYYSLCAILQKANVL